MPARTARPLPLQDERQIPGLLLEQGGLPQALRRIGSRCRCDHRVVVGLRRRGARLEGFDAVIRASAGRISPAKAAIQGVGRSAGRSGGRERKEEGRHALLQGPKEGTLGSTTGTYQLQWGLTLSC